ncbi:transcription elongation factor GreA [Aerococcus urinaehominis]|uniref:Transcription elongation factor GreA n=1 Tax=Aerococcus urinaehominis TaxID=128944 RepID=A0A0X8FLZ3_9LACT|nr:transcription elongation factor GreA [Aerococcus urinaehominis]AMB99766.1 transcription elongation factor GreA [Aerococcus urinaehominis]SDM09805.1 transcription elongation factor GreA [Aerococcus urinaehominis]
MDEKTYPMTEEGKAKLQAELDQLKSVDRKEIVERIKIARSYGDLSENSEYEAAKNEQAILEGQISKLEQMIRYAEIIDPDDVAADVVSLGKKVSFTELPDGEEETYSIVGKAEASPLDGKISNDSPIAQALIGHKLGEEVEIESPGGSFSVKITGVAQL